MQVSQSVKLWLFCDDIIYDEWKGSNKLKFPSKPVPCASRLTLIGWRFILSSKTSKAGRKEGEGVTVLKAVAFRGKLDTLRDGDRWATELETTE